jgi:hypothetical protein
MTWEEYDRQFRELARKGLAAAERGESDVALFYVVAVLDHVERNCPEEFRTSFPRQMEQQARRLAMRLFELCDLSGPTLQ